MAIDKILINSGPGETRVALVEQMRLCELVVTRADAQSFVGNVYLGRVERVLPAIQAAFVEIGLERAGFLAASEARHEARPVTDESGGAISDYVGEGDQVLVQVQRDPFEDKGAKLTMRISLPGRFLVYTPDQHGIKVSRRIEDEAARARLTGLLEDLAADDKGFIVRTSAAEAGDQEFSQDIQYLCAAWEEIVTARGNHRAPARLHRDLDPALQALRDEGGPDVKKIITDDPQSLSEIKAFCERFAPDLSPKAELHDGPQALFEAHDIEEQIERALSPAADLASGGDIVINETAALTAIDVNIGAASEGRGHEETALAVNLEAATAIAQQIRLRNLSGLIVIDFVSMKRHGAGEQVLEKFRREMARDSRPAYVVGFTRLGLVEMTRPRRRDSLSHILGGPCPACQGAGFLKSPESVAFEALRAVASTSGAALTLRAAPQVITALKGPASAALKEVEARLGQPLGLEPDAALPQERYDVVPGNG